MTGPQFAALRAARRAVARRLRNEGLPVRTIAARLGVSHPTVIADLREEPAMTAAYQMTADVPGPRAHADEPATPRADESAVRTRGHDEIAVKLNVLLRALDRAGLDGQLADCRALATKANEIDKASLADHHQARQEYGELVERVKAGEVSTADAARHLHGWQPFEPWSGTPTLARTEHPTPARLLAVQAVRELHRAAWRQAVRDAWDAHKALAKRADSAVKVAVKAGHGLVDVSAVVAALPSAKPKNRPTKPIQPGTFVAPPPVPVMPTVTLEQIQGNPKLMRRWGEATEAVRAFQAVHEVADLVHQMVGGRSMMFPGDVDSDQYFVISKRLPEQVQLAVFDVLGWRPGLHLSLKPVPPRPPAERMWTVPPPLKVGPHGTDHLDIQS